MSLSCTMKRFRKIYFLAHCYERTWKLSCGKTSKVLSNDFYRIIEQFLWYCRMITEEIVRQYSGKGEKLPRKLQKDVRLPPFYRFFSIEFIWNIYLSFCIALVINKVWKIFLKFSLPFHLIPKAGMLGASGITECQIWQYDK